MKNIYYNYIQLLQWSIPLCRFCDIYPPKGPKPRFCPSSLTLTAKLTLRCPPVPSPLPLLRSIDEWHGKRHHRRLVFEGAPEMRPVYRFGLKLQWPRKDSSRHQTIGNDQKIEKSIIIYYIYHLLVYWAKRGFLESNMVRPRNQRTLTAHDRTCQMPTVCRKALRLPFIHMACSRWDTIW
jgi:hypothetical protein